MSRIEAATESSMAQIKTVVTRSSRPLPLPAWAATFTLIVAFLRENRLLEELKSRCAIPRQGGYTGWDLLAAGLALFVAQDPKGIKGFSASMKDFGKRVAAVVGLKKLPASASISRILGAADRLPEPEEFVGWLLAQGCACRELLRHPLVLAKDALGDAWSIFDFDPSVVAMRLRALAQEADLPEAMRRSAGLCAPGYAGRKRGETQYSLAILSHAGAGLWMHVSAWAGNAKFAEAIGLAAQAVARTVAWAGLSRESTLLRFDGAGGNSPAICAVIAEGIHYLTRLGSCAVLRQPGVMEFLAAANWQPVRDSGSGPKRHATELGSWALGGEEFLTKTEDKQALRSRLVVSRFPAARDGKRHGSGVEIDDWHYEVFATDLLAMAWPAPDTVTLYYGRCGQENSFAQAGQEIQLGKTYSKTLAGQRLMTAIGMWVANLKRVMAVQHQGDLGSAPDQQPRPAQAEMDQQVAHPMVQPPVAQEQVELAAPRPPADSEPMEELASPADPLVVQAVEPDFGPVQAAAAEPPIGSAATQDLPRRVTTTEPPVTAEATAQCKVTAQILAQVAGTITCQAGALIPLHNLRVVNGIYTYATYRSPAGVCQQCVQFKGCTHSVYPGYRREFGVRIPGSALEFRTEILGHYKQKWMTEIQLATPIAPARPELPAAWPVTLPPAVATPPKPSPRAPAPVKPQGLRLVLPIEPAPLGPWIPAAASLFMPALLADWQAHVARHRVEVEVREPVGTTGRRWVRPSEAARQCRRQTWAQRQLYNASNAKVRITITEYV